MLVDYLIPKIYLSDILLLLNVGLNYLDKKNQKKVQIKNKKLNKIDIPFFILIIFLLLYQLGQQSLLCGLWSLRVLLLISFMQQISQSKLFKQHFYRALLLAVIWQSFLAYYQFIKQAPLANYHWFGESQFQTSFNISRGYFLNQEKILPYAATAHPNILAGMIVVFSIILIGNSTNQKTKVLLRLNSLIIIILTQSYAALLAWLISLWLSFVGTKLHSRLPLKKILLLGAVISFLLSPIIIDHWPANFFNQLSISRRQLLNQAAWQMWLDKPLLGVGWFNFVKQVENYSHNPEVVRFVQPVHHLGLLILSEGGLVTTLAVGLILWRKRQIINWQKLPILLPLASLDHYLVTQPVGLLLMILLVSSFTGRRTRT